MKYEKRCTNFNDFKSMFLENLQKDELIRRNPLVKSKYEKQALENWNTLTQGNDDFYAKHKYIDIVYNPDLDKYSRKKRSVGRPKSINAKIKSVTFRLTEEELKVLEDYCKINNKDQSAAIRKSIKLLSYTLKLNNIGKSQNEDTRKNNKNIILKKRH